MADVKNLLLLFDRPQEPVFVPKGENNTVFEVPDTFLADRYKAIGNVLQTRFGEGAEKIKVKNISIPDMRIPMSIGRHEQFSLFLPKHSEVASHLIKIFYGIKSLEDFQSVAVYARDRLNPYLFNYALSVALLHRPDTKNVSIPALLGTFPAKFIDSTVLNRVREEANIVPTGSRIPITVPRDYTASDLEEEHRLWYFREDMGINLHHWHWHLIYPFIGPIEIVRKDRRGELFYYMHQQIIARYNMERFSNNLARVTRLNNLTDPIPEAYFPKMDSLVASRAWPPRVSGSRLQDLNREADQIKVDVADLIRWRDRIYEAIDQGFIINSNQEREALDEVTGIDKLGDMIESAITSPNRSFYGDFHNMGHIFLGYIHDPDHRHLESFGVMAVPETAMRDPVFYRWHAYMDDIFQTYKEKLPPYTMNNLQYQGITIAGVQVQSEGGSPNTFQTYWQQSDLDLGRGMDFVPRGNVFARFTHLQHSPFTYTINVNNASEATRFGMVRIFLGPKNDERGQEMLFRDQRLMMVELDKFVVSLRPGQNTVRRRSDESSLTISFEQTFRALQQNRPGSSLNDNLEFNFCGCGWPDHMLLPKGLPGGLACELFVMISNFDDDRVDQDLTGNCSEAASFCGVRDRKYPDKRPMGFPFDRLPRTGIDRLATFLTPNMFVADVSVNHTNKTTVRQQ